MKLVGLIAWCGMMIFALIVSTIIGFIVGGTLGHLLWIVGMLSGLYQATTVARRVGRA